MLRLAEEIPFVRGEQIHGHLELAPIVGAGDQREVVFEIMQPELANA